MKERRVNVDGPSRQLYPQEIRNLAKEKRVFSIRPQNLENSFC